VGKEVADLAAERSYKEGKGEGEAVGAAGSQATLDGLDRRGQGEAGFPQGKDYPARPLPGP
jgi:hypothetical protein